MVALGVRSSDHPLLDGDVSHRSLAKALLCPKESHLLGNLGFPRTRLLAPQKSLSGLEAGSLSQVKTGRAGLGEAG